MTVIMPPDANIPPEWQNGTDGGRMSIIVPSWGKKDKLSYLVLLDLQTRELFCECKGFEYRKDCHHVRGLVWFCSGPRHKHKGMQPTSLNAWQSIQATLGDKQKIVLETIDLVGEASNKDLANLLGWPINTITPRVLELREMGLVENAGEKFDSHTNRSELTWKAA